MAMSLLALQRSEEVEACGWKGAVSACKVARQGLGQVVDVAERKKPLKRSIPLLPLNASLRGRGSVR